MYVIWHSHNHHHNHTDRDLVDFPLAAKQTLFDHIRPVLRPEKAELNDTSETTEGTILESMQHWKYCINNCSYSHFAAWIIFWGLSIKRDQKESPSGVESSTAMHITRPHSVVVVASTKDTPGFN